ncbi:MAG: hypothetical protein KDJ29_07245 [Hyphomicrobiales bacterium]|nr:hypothetical protein [Hyphomicrobiales bacterium]
MPEATMEDVYAALADGIDATGADKEAMFLSKVALLLANEVADAERVLQLIADARKNMDGMRRG